MILNSKTESGSNGEGLSALGENLGSSLVSPAIRKALTDPATIALAEVQLARIIESQPVQKALGPALNRIAVLAFVGVVAGCILANIITDKIK
jgi:hypothetical protein